MKQGRAQNPGNITSGVSTSRHTATGEMTPSILETLLLLNPWNL
jgi:hypothetical protein